jgi:hypothetical protein
MPLAGWAGNDMRGFVLHDALPAVGGLVWVCCCAAAWAVQTGTNLLLLVKLLDLLLPGDSEATGELLSAEASLARAGLRSTLPGFAGVLVLPPPRAFDSAACREGGKKTPVPA